jgi:hypothetical protein
MAKEISVSSLVASHAHNRSSSGKHFHHLKSVLVRDGKAETAALRIQSLMRWQTQTQRSTHQSFVHLYVGFGS